MPHWGLPPFVRRRISLTNDNALDGKRSLTVFLSVPLKNKPILIHLDLAFIHGLVCRPKYYRLTDSRIPSQIQASHELGS